MKVRLLACAEPYISYATARDPEGSLVFCEEGGAADRDPPEVLVIPAESFLALGAEARRRQASIAYGPAGLMGACFEAGCVDYLRDPWPLEELAARLGRIERPRFRLGTALVELRGSLLSTDAAEVSLSESERRLLRVLYLNRGRPVPREALRSALGGCFGASSRLPDVHIASIRKKLEALVPGASSCLRACRGLGYRLDVDACG
ncbi:MAG TPA: winged helix-turn-helix domain-containing protein [Rectinemataceae bacterium]|nr:winged helix-turn-helix domain-containing protein [Rectinemataceae bacterium]